VRSAAAVSNTADDSVPSGEFSGAVVVGGTGTDGGDGTDGLNVATVYIYQRTATDSAPTLPSATATYTFATGNVTGLNNGWTDTVPAAGGNPFLWVTIATASNTTPADAIGSGEWQAAEHLAQDGGDGGDGDSVHVSTIYQRAASAPAPPTGGSYNFTTNELIPPSGWTEAVSAAGPDPMYASTGNWSVPGSTGTDSSTVWSTPVQVSTGGADIGDLAHILVQVPDGAGTTTGDFRVGHDGDPYRQREAEGYVSRFTWQGSGAVGDYEYWVQLTSGSTPTGGTRNSWRLGSEQNTYRITRPSGAGQGTTECDLIVKYRRISDNLELGSHTVHFAITIL